MKIVNAYAALAIAASCSFVCAHTQPALPDGVSAADWLQIESQIQAHRFHVQAHQATTGGWHAANPSHGFRIDYRPDGQTLLTLESSAASDQAPHRIGLQLQGYGYGDELIELNTAPALSANGNTLTYQWKPGLREWWINNEQGVAQWFELAERPAIATNGQPLVVAMQLATELNANIQGDALHLRSSDGSIHLTYDRLKVWDATGRILPAEMVLNENRLALQVEDADAVYPVTIDPTFAQAAYLKASNSDPIDRFGWSMALSGDTVVVGAPGESSAADTVDGDQADNSADNAGAAYVFVRGAGGAWTQQAYLKASNSEAFDEFGFSVAVSGDTVVVGAPEESSAADDVNGDQSDNSATAAGAAYVFVRDGSGAWSQQAYLKASNSDDDDNFGHSVAVSGDTVVVAAELEASGADGVDGDQADNSAQGAGAAYVFVRDTSGTWSQQAYLKASNSDSGDQFGSSVAMSNDTLVVAAENEASDANGIDGDQADNSAQGAGAAYVFVRDASGGWTQQAYLKASNSDENDNFGRSVAVSGDTVVVGAEDEASGADGVDGDQADNSAEGAGAAYVFVRDGSGAWTQQAYLKASNSDADDQFGRSVAVLGDIVVVGADQESSEADGVDGDQADNSAQEAGAAYVFVRDASDGWTQQVYLKASNSDENDNFGRSVAVSGGTVVVSAPLEDSDADGVDGDQSDNSAGSAGAAYVFSLSFTVGGTVNGLAAGNSVTLVNNSGDSQTVNADGPFSFSPQLSGTAYNVTVQTQPTNPNQTCTVSNGMGTVSSANVTNIDVICVTDQFTVGGTVSGLNGTGLALQNNSGDDLPITADGPFTFPTALDDGSNYAVTVLTQPSSARDQQCTVSNGSGTLNGADVTDIAVSCLDITLSLSSSDQDFGLIFLGASGSGTITLTNTGTPKLTIDSIGAPADPFSITGGTCMNLPITLVAAETCTIEISFTPTAIDDFSDQIVISSNAVSSPDAIVLRGNALLEPLIVPTLNIWGLLLMFLMLAIGGLLLRSKASV